MQQEQYWQAVLERDAHLDGVFVYAVHSTGIYCIPSCPSRKPRREHVSFFEKPEEAEKAGYRPCRRCRPGSIETEKPHVELVQQICSYIQSHLEEDLSLTSLGELVNVSPYHLQRVFKQAMGITPHQYVEASRLKQLKERLKEGDAVTKAMYDAGYGSSSRLYEHAPAHLGMTPGAYQRGGQNMFIDYTIVDSSLGRLLVAATEKGVCAVCLGDDDERLEAALLTEYPAAAIQRDGEALDDWVAAILRYLDGRQPDLNLPVDVQATAFQWSVWQALRSIPYGETRSYSQVAQELGDASKARAVANACANNPVALVVPCHRVVRENGALGGYRWGIERKRRLLAQEQARVTNEPLTR